MKFSVNAEFTDDELAEYAASVVTKVLGAAWHDIGGALANPQASAIAMNLLSNLSGVQQRQRARPTVGTVGSPFGVPHYPPGPYGPGPVGPSPLMHPSPFMQGIAHGVQAAMQGLGIADAGAPSPQNVQPIREPTHVDRCFPIEATRNVEAGIACCRCATYNNVLRTQCRHCGHILCHGAPPSVPPPPAMPPDPSEAS